MSIQEFHTQLTQADQPNAVIASLGRLITADDTKVVAHFDDDKPAGSWFISAP